MSAPIGPYSPIVSAGPWLVCSGQLGLAPSQVGAQPALVEGGVIAQLRQALANAAALLDGAGADLGDVAKTTVFLTSMSDYPAVNEAYAEFFGSHRPARSVVAVAGLPMGAFVEVEVWAYRDGS
ncbi:MAG TPA: Rid family hydrolase [Acidimicrobiales bacterium]|jgi:2-iminobutanoate/2-iminopropanoate deaminase|nr:Rid family hydrolase [Acidimicrobiales bacterium]